MIDGWKYEIYLKTQHQNGMISTKIGRTEVWRTISRNDWTSDNHPTPGSQYQRL
jgi:hypothetical protein